MSEPASTSAAIESPGLRMAVRLGGALLVALIAVLGMATRDQGRRGELETTRESSAAGDTRYLRIPEEAPAEPWPAVAHFDGRPLFPVSYKRHEKREAEMTPVTRDEAAGLTIYQAPVKAKDADDAETARTYFLKLGPGEFLKVRLGDSPP